MPASKCLERSHLSVLPASGAIAKLGNALLLCAMVTTKEFPVLLKAVAENSDTTGGTGRGESMDCTFEAIVGMGFPTLGNLERLIVIVSASLAFGHGITMHFLKRTIQNENSMPQFPPNDWDAG
jgi:hypothetical protein